MSGIKKESRGYYNNYEMIVFIDAAKQEHWVGHSQYLLQGFITVVSDTEEGLKKQIDWVNARVKLLAILDKQKGITRR